MRSIAVKPASDEASLDLVGNVGVMILSAPVSVTPAALPPEGILDILPDTQPHAVVAFGDDDGGTDTSLSTLQRRFSPVDFKSLGAEQVQLALVRASKSLPHPRIGALNEAGPAYLGSTDEIAAISLGPDGGSCARSRNQRLNVLSVRSFLSAYVTLL